MEVMTVSIRTNAGGMGVQMGLLSGLCWALVLSLVLLRLGFRYRAFHIVDGILELIEEEGHACGWAGRPSARCW